MDLVGIINRGSAVVLENNAANHLRRCAEALVSAVSAYEGFGVVAASPQAERVLGAAMMLAPTMHGYSDGPSIVFDVNYASGTLLARAARRLRDRGNEAQLIGVVLNPLIDANTDIHITELDCVHVEWRRALLRQEDQCGVDRIAVFGRG